MQIRLRAPAPAAAATLEQAGIHPALARIFAARGVQTADELSAEVAQLIPPTQLRGADEGAQLLADALAAQKKIVIVADYDCDGATACAVALRGLRMLGATVGCPADRIDYIVPNRFEYGYGLSPEIVALAARHPRLGRPDLLVTVDNGIASVDGVAAAQDAGIDVLVTDHHLPGEQLPAARCIVNPNQPGCTFPSKHLAGVGVMFYQLLALRAELRQRGAFDAAHQPRIDNLLDLVALGTVADVVKLDANNRILVAQGLKRMRAHRMQPGIAALFAVAGRDPSRATAFDLGFGLGPRLNAAGRLADMTLGIACLTTDDPARAAAIAAELDSMNRERRDIEAGMQVEALRVLEDLEIDAQTTIALTQPTWHQGVIGIVASRLKEKFHRPTITFAPGDDDVQGATLKGSGRSIAGFHLRDALDLVSKREPGLLLKFGGHAMAAGLTIRADDFDRFAAAFEQVGREWLNDEQLTRTLETDGELDDQWLTPQFVELLDAQVWGQGFPAPVFSCEFKVVSQRLLKDKHLKLLLARGARKYDAIWFNHADALPDTVLLAWRPDNNTFNGTTRVQLVVEGAGA